MKSMYGARLPVHVLTHTHTHRHGYTHTLLLFSSCLSLIQAIFSLHCVSMCFLSRGSCVLVGALPLFRGGRWREQGWRHQLHGSPLRGLAANACTALTSHRACRPNAPLTNKQEEHDLTVCLCQIMVLSKPCYCSSSTLFAFACVYACLWWTLEHMYDSSLQRLWRRGGEKYPLLTINVFLLIMLRPALAEIKAPW